MSMKIGWCAALLSCCTVVGGEAGLGEAGLLSSSSSSSSSSLSSPSFSPTGAPPPIPDHSRKEPMRSQVLTYLSALDACCDVGNPRCKFEAATLYLLPEARSEALQSLYTSASKNFVHLPRSPNDASTLLSDAMEGGSAQALVLGALALSAGLATVKTSGDVDPTVWPASSCQDENTEIDLRRNFTTSWISEKMLYYVVENGHALFDTDDGSGHNAAIMAYASLASSRAVGAARMAAGEAKSRKRRTRDTNGNTGAAAATATVSQKTQQEIHYEGLAAHWCEEASGLYTEAATMTINEIQDTAIDEFLPPVRISLTYEEGRVPAMALGQDTQTVEYLESLTDGADEAAADASFELGNMYMGGDPIRGVEIDYERAWGHFSHAGALDHGPAHHNMALMDLQGMGKEINETSALENYRRAADLGEISALAGMAYMYMQGKVEGVAPKEARKIGLDLLKQAAQFDTEQSSSSGDALVALGYYYMTGEDDPQAQNTTKAIEYFKRAADLGVTTGLYHWSLLQLGTSPYVPQGEAAIALKDNANCSRGLEGMREVALRGRWIADALPWSTELAYSNFVHGKTDRALLHYMLTAEIGSPTSQVNAAFLLQRGFGMGFASPSILRHVSLLMQDHVVSGQTSVGWRGLELTFSKELFDRINPWHTTSELKKCKDNDSSGAPDVVRFANQDRHLALLAAKRLATLSDRQNVGEASRMLAECKLAPEEWGGVCALDKEGAYDLFERGSDLGDSEATFKLGMSYLSGQRKNVTKAREYLLLCNDMDRLAGWPCSLVWYFSWILVPENALISWLIRFLFGF